MHIIRPINTRYGGPIFVVEKWNKSILDTYYVVKNTRYHLWWMLKIEGCLLKQVTTDDDDDEILCFFPPSD